MLLLRLLAPRYRASAAFRLSPRLLRAWGIDALMLDLDNTLVPWGERTPPQAVVDWITDLRRSGIPACVVSNSLSARVRAASALLGLSAAAGGLKPGPSKLRDALRILGTPRDRTAMVGDQLFTDVLAGNRLGVPTVLTAPLAPGEPLRIRVLRRLEGRLLAAMARRGLAPAVPEV